MKEQTGQRINVVVGERISGRPAIALAAAAPTSREAALEVPPFDHELHARLELVRTRVRDEAVHLNQVDAVATEYLASTMPRLRLLP